MVIVVFAIADFISAFQALVKVLPQATDYDTAFVFSFTLIFVIGVEFSAHQLGKLMKKRQQGYAEVSNTQIGLLLVTAVILFAILFSMRLKYAAVIIPPIEGITSPNTSLTINFFWALVPVASFFLIFVMSFEASNPLEDEIKVLTLKKEALVKTIERNQQILDNINAEEKDLKARLTEQDELLYQTMFQEIQRLQELYKVHARMRISQHLANTSAHNGLADSEKAIQSQGE